MGKAGFRREADRTGVYQCTCSLRRCRRLRKASMKLAAKQTRRSGRREVAAQLA